MTKTILEGIFKPAAKNHKGIANGEQINIEALSPEYKPKEE